MHPKPMTAFEYHSAEIDSEHTTVIISGIKITLWLNHSETEKNSQQILYHKTLLGMLYCFLVN